MRNRVLFESSNILCAEHDDVMNVVLVTFKGGKQYAFGKFLPEHMADWQKSPSAGSWFHRNVRTQPQRHPPVTMEQWKSEQLDSAALVVKREPPQKTPEGSWRDEQPRSVEVISKAPMLGKCTGCGVDLEVLARIGATGHVCYAKVDETKCDDKTHDYARALYESYVANSGWLNYEGKPCPPWELLSTAVRSHWCAVALFANELLSPPLVLRMSGVIDSEVAKKLEAMEHENASRPRAVILDKDSENDAQRRWRGDDYRPWRSKGRL